MWGIAEMHTDDIPWAMAAMLEQPLRHFFSWISHDKKGGNDILKRMDKQSPRDWDLISQHTSHPLSLGWREHFYTGKLPLLPSLRGQHLAQQDWSTPDVGSTWFPSRICQENQPITSDPQIFRDLPVAGFGWLWPRIWQTQVASPMLVALLPMGMDQDLSILQYLRLMNIQYHLCQGVNRRVPRCWPKKTHDQSNIMYSHEELAINPHDQCSIPSNVSVLSSIIIIKKLPGMKLSSIIINYHQLSSIIINYHQLLSIIIIPEKISQAFRATSSSRPVAK